MIEIYETPQELETAAKAAGIKMRDVAARAQIAHTTWYRWRNGETQPTYAVRARLGTALIVLKQEMASA